MEKVNLIDRVAFYLVLLGGLNWGIVGLRNYNIVDDVFGRAHRITDISTILYTLMGVSSVYLFMRTRKLFQKEKVVEDQK